jgi:hypothetical protein
MLVQVWQKITKYITSMKVVHVPNFEIVMNPMNSFELVSNDISCSSIELDIIFQIVIYMVGKAIYYILFG